MTTWENIDNEIERVDNLTVTSDTAYERITNDLKIEDTRDDGSLKQNTAWLVQEIPNISFLDISDTMLESKKTFHGREYWNIIIWKEGKSVEAQPQDIWIYWDVKQDTNTWLKTLAEFQEYTAWSNNICFENNSGMSWYKILRDWIYKIAFSFWIDNIANTAADIWHSIVISRGGSLIFLNTWMYWWTSALWLTDYCFSGTSHIEWKEWDIVWLAVRVRDANANWVTWKYHTAELTIQYMQDKIW